MVTFTVFLFASALRTSLLALPLAQELLAHWREGKPTEEQTGGKNDKTSALDLWLTWVQWSSFVTAVVIAIVAVFAYVALPSAPFCRY